MGDQYHITKSGEASKCEAKNKCPLGGEHFSSKKEAERSLEDAKRDKIITPLRKSKKQTPKITDSMIQKNVDLTSSDRAMLQKIKEGGKISDARLDKFLMDRKSMELPGRSNFDSGAAQKIYEFAKNEREERGTPSTFLTGKTFDPKIHSTIQDKKVRESLQKDEISDYELARAEKHLVNSMSKTRGAHEWALQQSEESKRAADTFSDDPEEQEYYIAFGRKRAEDAKLHAAHLRAQNLEYRESILSRTNNQMKVAASKTLENQLKDYDSVELPQVKIKK